MLRLAEIDPTRARAESDPSVRPDLETRVELALIDRRGTRTLIQPHLRTRGFAVSTRWTPVVPPRGWHAAFDVEIAVVSHDEHIHGLGVQVRLPMDGPATHFMVPGVFYRENRRTTSKVRYPRFTREVPPVDGLAADYWAVRADRASHPVVIGWSKGESVGLATREQSPLGLNGLGFGDIDGQSVILVNFPAREEPVTYAGHDAPAPSEVLLHKWQAGEIVTLTFKVFGGEADAHAYDALMRSMYQGEAAANPLQPWMPPSEAASLVAYALQRWHYRPDSGTFAETIAFERGSDEGATAPGDRESMHVARLSGALVAHAMLSDGRRTGDADSVAAGTAVLDTIAGRLAPCGIFWEQLSGTSWDGGWNGHSERVHMRTAAEATLFMIRALALESAAGVAHPRWETAVASNLRFALGSQCQNGAFPSYVNAVSGAAEEWDGAAGLLWTACLIEGSAFAGSTNVFGSAERAGAHYAHYVEQEFIYGAPEDVHLTPSSEDAYNAVIAYVSLYESTANPRWLRLARHAADWMMTFRWSYNVAFPQHTLLETYDFRSRGADVASPRNQHLQAYGLICLPEMLRLAEHAEDPYFLERTRDNLACFLQFIAREDGDFNARKGMVSERYYHTRCFGPKGAILPLSHAWTAGLVLYACQFGLDLLD